MASALAMFGNAYKFHRLFDLTVFATIAFGYIVLMGCLAAALGTSKAISAPGTEQTLICQCSSEYVHEVLLKATPEDVQWTSWKYDQ